MKKGKVKFHQQRDTKKDCWWDKYQLCHGQKWVAVPNIFKIVQLRCDYFWSLSRDSSLPLGSFSGCHFPPFPSRPSPLHPPSGLLLPGSWSPAFLIRRGQTHKGQKCQQEMVDSWGGPPSWWWWKISWPPSPPNLDLHDVPGYFGTDVTQIQRKICFCP